MLLGQEELSCWPGADPALLLSVPGLAQRAEAVDETYMAINFFLSKQGHGTWIFKKLHLAEISAASIGNYSQLQFYPTVLCKEH